MSLNKLPLPLVLAAIYSVSILLGAVMLKLPASSVDAITWSDAVFTATSAVTVTGLVVFDAGQVLTPFGQMILMLLIQLGGMGLMTFAVVVLSSIGMQIDISQRSLLREEMGGSSFGTILQLARTVFAIVLICEGVGFILLSLAFVPDWGWNDGVWLALFHSISAFNNAGFSLLSGGIVDVASQPLITTTLSVQFIVGGLGFAVLAEFAQRRRWTAFSLHTRMMLTGSIALILISLIVYGSLEWNNPTTLGAFSSVSDRLSVLWFEAVTPRTAGFNAVDTSNLSSATTLFTMVMMVIGGGSTSTAGGIKVTTAFVLVLATIAFFRQSGRMRAFGYSLGAEQGLKVMALLTVSVIVIVTSLFVILATHDLVFLDAAFEVVSAFGTVGLSRGATGELNDVGRFAICVTMFLGRIGPLTLGVFLAKKRAPAVRYPPGEVYLG